MRSAIVASVRENFDASKAKAALAWYQSELGMKIRAADARAQTPEGHAEVVAYSQGLQSTPPDPERLELAGRLDAGTRSTETSMRIIAALMRGMLGGLSALAPEGQEVPAAAEINGMIDQQLSQLAPMVQSQSLVFLLFTSHDLSLAEIRSHLAFVESDAGQWFHQQLAGGFTRAMSRAGKAMGDYFAATTDRAKAQAAETKTEGEVGRLEGEAFGKSSDQTACLNEAFVKRNACRDFVCFARTRSFLEACLDTSRKDAALCRGVPKSEDLAASVYWRLDRCEQRGTTTSACNELMGTIQERCAAQATQL